MTSPRVSPAPWEADVVLLDGGTAHVRTIRPEDAEAVQEFHLRQSPESVYLRFFADLPRLSPRDLKRFTEVDHDQREALVATVGGEIVGIARYDRLQPGGSEAEVAFNIADRHSGRGIGSILLEHLAAIARERGVGRFIGEVLPQNRRMISIFRDAGYEVRHSFSEGVVELSFDIAATPRSWEVMHAREHRAESRSIAALLNPESVVVVGASRNPLAPGHQLLRHIVDAGFTGRLHVVNPMAEDLLGIRAVRWVREVPGPVDLAVLMVPVDAVEAIVLECAAIRVRTLLVATSGFAESGEEGLARQRSLVRLAHSHGMRVLGPKSFGVLNTDPRVRLNATLSPRLPPQGRLGLFSQSGALGVALLSSVTRRRLGLSTFVSAGNRADISGNDCMQYWLDDHDTAAVGLYLESIGNPRKFSRVARALAQAKPVIAVKSGVSGYGVPPGHVVRASRAPRAALIAMLRQSGVIRVDDAHQLLDVAQLVSFQPLPGGSRVGIVGNSDAVGALVADACASWGLTVTHGPVSVDTGATLEEFRAPLEAVFADPDVDAVVACYFSPLVDVLHEIATVLVQTATAAGRTCVACLAGQRLVLFENAAPSSGGGRADDDGRVHDDTRRPGVPSYSIPEDAVRALAAAAGYAAWRRVDHGRPWRPEGMDLRGVRELAVRALAAARTSAEAATEDGLALDGEQTARLLRMLGIELWPGIAVHDADQAVAAAEQLGWPVALKSLAPRRHQTGPGALRLDISDVEEMRTAVHQMSQRLAPLGPPSLLVQPMAPDGVGTILRTVEDPLLGPLVCFGLAGDATDLLEDWAYRVPPMTELDVQDLIRSPRASPRLFGLHGAPKADVTALGELVARVGLLSEAVPEVAELVLDPVLVGTTSLAVLGARVRLASAAGRADSDRRTLPDT